MRQLIWKDYTFLSRSLDSSQYRQEALVFSVSTHIEGSR